MTTVQQNPMEVFQREAPEVAAAFNGLIQVARGLERDRSEDQATHLHRDEGLDGRRQRGTAHVPMAKAAGATKAEVVDAILMTLTVSGVRGVVTCLPEAVRQFEQE